MPEIKTAEEYVVNKLIELENKLEEYDSYDIEECRDYISALEEVCKHLSYIIIESATIEDNCIVINKTFSVEDEDYNYIHDMIINTNQPIKQ